MSVCRVRAQRCDLGLIVVIVDAPESDGPPIECAISSLIPALMHTEIGKLPGYEDFDSAMWFLGLKTQQGGIFLRIRETEEHRFEVETDHLPPAMIGDLLGLAPEDIFERARPGRDF